MKLIYSLVSFLLLSYSLFSQEKACFDRNGKSSSEDVSNYCRVKTGDSFKSHYTSNSALYFEGKLLDASSTDEALNKYTGVCTWYFKNGKKKAVRAFDEKGREHGMSVYYFESGKIWKEEEYNQGLLVDNILYEYDEYGHKSRLFIEDFNNNNNDWDLYLSDKSLSEIKDGYLKLSSFTKEGATRYISVPSLASDYAIEAVINISELNGEQRAGIIYGFKDWDNYNYFFISKSVFHVGFVYEGVKAVKADGMFSGDIDHKGNNRIKVITDNGKNFFSINGEIQFTTDLLRNLGSNIGIGVSGKSSVTVDKLICKDLDVVGHNNASSSASDLNVKGNGTGLILSTNGLIVTNYHVIENASKILAEVSFGEKHSYSAEVVQIDKENDLALLKIKDERFSLPGPVQFSFKEGGAEVGASVFTLGYPMAMSGMGKEVKFTDGKISSKTGYNNAINTYQTSIPVQPGNSGGPLFNDKGELVGVINAKVTGADNVSYAIKLNYVRNLLELLPSPIEIPKNAPVALSTEENIRVLKNYVVLIKIK